MILKKRLKKQIFYSFILLSSLIIFSTCIEDSENNICTNTWEFPIIPHPQEIYLNDENRYFNINHQTQILLDDYSFRLDSSDIDILYDFLRSHELSPLRTLLIKETLDSNNSIILLKRITDNHVLAEFPLLEEFNFTEKYPGP